MPLPRDPIPVRAAIFDLDGLLVDSELVWARAEVEVFAEVGLQLTLAQTHETIGLVIEEAVAYRHRQHPWSGASVQEVSDRIMDRVIEIFAFEGRLLPGVERALALFRERGCRLGLATSSHPRIVGALLERLGLATAFDHVQTAFGLVAPKPHPEVYLVAARALGVSPLASLALEDSVTGLIAAKAARMRAIAVPDPSVVGDPRLSLADLVLGSLLELDEASLRLLGV